MEYSKTGGVSGAWVKAAEVQSGTRCKLVSECVPVEGAFGTQNVAKIRFEGDPGEAKNVNVNKPSINGLIDAFGSDSKNWIGKVLTAQTEKMIVGGKRVTAFYLVPENYELSEDSGGYLTITPKDQKTALKITPPASIRTRSKEEVEEGIDIDKAFPDEDTREVPIEAYENEPNPDDVPF